MEYPGPNADFDTWINWYRWKLNDMDKLLQAAYRDHDRLRNRLLKTLRRLDGVRSHFDEMPCDVCAEIAALNSADPIPGSGTAPPGPSSGGRPGNHI